MLKKKNKISGSVRKKLKLKGRGIGLRRKVFDNDRY